MARRMWIAAACGTTIPIVVGIAFLSMNRTPGRTTSEIAAILQPLVSADKFILYSIDGNNFEFPTEKPIAGEDFYGCPVLGKVEISDQIRRKAMIDTIEVGLREMPAPAACFWPHHAIRAEKDGQTVDYVFCFHCSNFRIYRNDTIAAGGPITPAPEKLLNQYLTDAGIPIATK